MRNRQPQLGRSLIVIIGFPFCRLEEEEEEEEEEVVVAAEKKDEGVMAVEGEVAVEAYWV